MSGYASETELAGRLTQGAGVPGGEQHTGVGDGPPGGVVPELEFGEGAGL